MKRGSTEFDLSDFLFDTYLKLKGAPVNNNEDGGSNEKRRRSSMLSNKVNPITDSEAKKSRQSIFNGPKEEVKVPALDDTEKMPMNQQ